MVMSWHCLRFLETVNHYILEITYPQSDSLRRKHTESILSYYANKWVFSQNNLMMENFKIMVHFVWKRKKKQKLRLIFVKTEIRVMLTKFENLLSGKCKQLKNSLGKLPYPKATITVNLKHNLFLYNNDLRTYE